MYNLAQSIELKRLRVTQRFTYADTFLHRAVSVVDAVFFSERNQLDKK